MEQKVFSFTTVVEIQGTLRAGSLFEYSRIISELDGYAIEAFESSLPGQIISAQSINNVTFERTKKIRADELGVMPDFPPKMDVMP